MATQRRTRAFPSERIPLPLAFAGIGLIGAVTMPGALSGGGGFVVGLVAGLVVVAVRAFAQVVQSKQAGRSVLIQCPHCSRDIKLSACTPRKNVETTAQNARVQGDRRV